MTIAPVGVDATDPTTIVRAVSAPTRWVSLAATRRSNAIRQSTPELLAWLDAGTVTAAEAQVADDRPGLLRQPGLVEAAHDVAVEHRGRAEHLADGDHAGAADAREAHREGVGRAPRARDRGARRRDRRSCRRRGLAALRPSASSVTMANAGQSPCRHDVSKLQLVWWMRVLRPYARVDRLHRQAVALVAAVAAPLAHPLVDDDAPVRLLDDPAAAVAPQLGRAALVVHEHGDAGDGGQLDLALHQHRAVAHLDPAVGRAGRSRRRPTCPGRRT